MDLARVVIILILLRHSAGTIYFHTVEGVFNPAYTESCAVAVFNGSDGVSRLNWTGTILTDVEKIVVAYEIRGKTDQQSTEYDKLHLKGTIDTCDMSKGPVGNLITKMGLTKPSKFTNFKLECPYKKGFYYAVNFPVPDDKFIPYAISNAAGKFEVTSVNRGKVAGVEGMVHISTTKVFGTAVENPMIKI